MTRPGLPSPAFPAGAAFPPPFPQGPPSPAPPVPAQPQPPPAPAPAPSPADQLNALRELGAVGGMPKADPDIHFLPIIGQVEGHLTLPAKNKTTKYEHVLPQLAAIEQDDRIRGVLVLLNTVGGDIEAGLAIAEMIRGLSKPTVSLVLGGGHSIGAPIAVAADYSFIAPTATIIVHPIRLTGMLIGVPQTYEYLDKMQDRIIRFIVTQSRISEGKLREIMFRTGELMRDVGTVLIGKDAVDVGLIHQLGSISHAIGYLRHEMERRRTAVFAGVALPPAPPPSPAPSPVIPSLPVSPGASPVSPSAPGLAPPSPSPPFPGTPGGPGWPS